MTKKPAKRAPRATLAKPAAKKVRAKKPSARAIRASGKASASKLDRIITALRAPKGATIPDLMQLTGWQAHSVRGALSGALKKDRGLAIASEKIDGERVYRIEGRR